MLPSWAPALLSPPELGTPPGLQEAKQSKPCSGHRSACPHHHHPLATGWMDPAFWGGLAPQEWVQGVRGGLFCRLGAEQGFCLHPIYPAHPLILGMLRRCQEDAKRSPACSHWIPSFPWKLAVLQRWLCKETSLLPCCCPSHPGSPEDAAVAAEGWLGGDRRLGGMSRGTGRVERGPGALGGWRDIQGHWEQ